MSTTSTCDSRFEPGEPLSSTNPSDDGLVQTAHRMPRQLLTRARTKAESEGGNLTSVITAALTAYAENASGSPVTHFEPGAIVLDAPRARKVHDRPLTSTDLSDDRLVMSAHHMPRQMILRAKAQTDLDGVTVTSVIVAALTAYTESTPGAMVTFLTPEANLRGAPCEQRHDATQED